MTMTVDNTQQRQFGGGMNFDPLSYSMPANPPHFTNPWTSSSVPSQSHGIYAPTQHGLPSSNLGLDGLAKASSGRSNISMSYASVPSMTAASAGSSLLGDMYSGQQDLLTLSQDMMSSNRMQPAYDAYTSAASPHSTAYTATTSSTPYDSLGYAPAPMRSTYALQAPASDPSRRLSQASVPSTTSTNSTASTPNSLEFSALPSPRPMSYVDFDDRSSMASDSARSFADAIDASRGMVAMSQEATPRNIYGPGNRSGRGSADSYGFPSTHSTSSSISSSSDYPQYFGGSGSVHSSISDYSNAGSDIESSSRTLPRPASLMHTSVPPAPQSMMGQFSSKVSSSTQKKHKCKVCDKRFTRPSSLQTHMYSHTGEKPFHCKVEGCGRNFSVVSNLRRHRKVHKGDARSDAGSDGHHSD